MFWTVMMISLIRDKFYKEVPQYELNYVGTMIQNPQIEQKNAPAIRSYFPTFALPDLQIQKTMEDGEKNLWNHDYLIDRYKDRIDLFWLTKNIPKSLLSMVTNQGIY